MGSSVSLSWLDNMGVRIEQLVKSGRVRREKEEKLKFTFSQIFPSRKVFKKM